MSPSSPPLPDYRDRLGQQLAVAGPVAIDMLAERTVLDTTLALAALEAATLLTESTVAPEQSALRAQVLRAAQLSAVPDRMVREHLSTEVRAWPQGDLLAREARVRELVALAGVRSVVSHSERWRLDRILEDAVAAFELAPQDYADLSPAAVYLDDALELPEAHPASVLLDSLRLAETLAADPLPAASLEAVFRAARAQVAATNPSRNNAWVTLFAEFGQAVSAFVKRVTEQPAVALAADAASDEDAVPRERQALWSHPGRGELNLLSAGHLLQLEWFGDPDDHAPDAVLLGETALIERASPLLGARLWDLPSATPVGKQRIVLVFGDQHIPVTPGAHDVAP